MFKSIAVAGTSLLMLGFAMSPAFARENADAENIDQMQQGQVVCRNLAQQFDQAKSGNVEARALRKKGWNNCFDSQTDGPPTGIKQLKEALNMIGEKPAVM